MKLITNTVMFCLFNISILAQNLVPNPSFEEYDYLPMSLCDDGFEFADAIKNWKTPNLASTDLINPRFRNKRLNAIPPKTGKNMVGCVYQGNHWAEYITVELKKPIEPGVTYYVEYWTSSPEYYSGYDMHGLQMNQNFGMLFGKKFFNKDKLIIKGTPQLFITSPIDNIPGQWVKISGTITLEEEATHIYIGQFVNEKYPTEIVKGYWFVDDVLVEAIKGKAEKYIPKVSIQIGDNIELQNIYFETDKHVLLPESFPALEKLLKLLKDNQSLEIKIEGHTDIMGNDVHNKDLSGNRAKAVFAYLIENGIEDSRLKIKGYGSSQPIADNTTEQGRQQNRRVEFEIEGNYDADKEKINAVPELVYKFSSQLPKSNPHKMALIGKAVKCDKGASRRISENKKIEFKTFKPTSAKKYILSKTENEKVVLINERPDLIQNRAFMISLLEDLKKQGFESLGIEALTYNDPEMNTRGYPHLKSGYFTQEPLFGDLIRTAQELGFEIFAFDAKPEQQTKAMKILKSKVNLSKEALGRTAKEWSQAMNIKAFIKKKPNSKTLIYCRYERIQEKSLDGYKHMAEWFKTLTNIDPLTIDQVTMTERCKNESPYYSIHNSAGPVVYKKREKYFIQKEDGEKLYDIQVFHPRVKVNANGRPKYLSLDGKRKPFFFNPAKFQMSYPALVLAYKEGEKIENAVPMDVIEMDGKSEMALMLPVGNYTLVIRDSKEGKKLDIVVE